MTLEEKWRRSSTCQAGEKLDFNAHTRTNLFRHEQMELKGGAKEFIP